MMRSRSKKIYGLVGGLVVLLITLIAVTAQTTYTFSSRASEDPETITVASLSQSIQELPADIRPGCVRSATYFPSTTNTQTSCFVQFRCAEGAAELPDIIQSYRCTSDEAGITCDIHDECVLLVTWAKRAGAMCGC